MNSQSIGVGLLGLGVVGSGVVQILQDRKEVFEKDHEFGLDIRRIAVRDTGKARAVVVAPDLLTDDPASVIQDPNVQILVEVMGGLEPARTLCLSALEAGKDVITANKALIAEHGDELFRVAYANDAGFAFEASVCGGIPIIRSLTQGLSANRIGSLYGILNGTTNYILTKMSDEGGSFDEILGRAQALGFAEADPTMDVDGTDAAQKLSILCRLAFGAEVPYAKILREGIDQITPLDIEYARDLGYAIKLLGIARDTGDHIEARVHPTLVRTDTLLANIKDEFNAVEVVGDAAGPQVYYGRGAGALPTASAIVSDLLEQADRRTTGRQRVSRRFVEVRSAAPIPKDRIRTSYYCRFTVQDTPGVLAEIAQIFSQHTISIATVIQQGRSEEEGGAVPLIMTTHVAVEADMQQAIDHIGGLVTVKGAPQVLRIESFKAGG